MKVINTNSYFVSVLENHKGKIIRRKKRKGIKPYARTLSFKKIKRLLLNSNILYPKILKNRFNYVYEEYIEPTNNIDSLSKKEISDYFVNLVCQLNNIDISKHKNYVSWKNNSEFIEFQINNFYKSQKNNNEKLEEAKKMFEKLDTKMDNNRKLSFIHGDLHLNNLIINNNSIYLIDWEMATIGDLAYELAIHFILMNYSENEELEFINKLLLIIECDKEKLIHDINEYKRFEIIRRNLLHSNIENHYH